MLRFLRFLGCKSFCFFVAVAVVSPMVVAQGVPEGWVSRPLEGGGTFYEASGLPVGSTFNVWAPAPLQVGQSTLVQAFAQVKQKGLQGIDTTGLSGRCEEANEKQGTVTQSCRMEGAGRQAVNLQYVMLPLRSGKAHFLRILTTGDPNLLQKYQDGFGRVMKMETARWAADAKSETASQLSAPAAVERPAKALSPKEQSAQARRDERAAIARAIRTEPGKGLQDGQYHSVLFSWDQVWIAGLQYVETIYLLLHDGTAYADLSLPPQDFNVAASKKLEPHRWVQWRRSGSKYEVRAADASKWTELQAWPAVPAQAGERLHQTYTNSSYANHGGLGGYASTSSFVFQPNGRFEQVGYTSTATGSMQAANGFTSGSSTSTSGKGTTSSSGVSAGGVNASTTPGSTGAPSVVTAQGRTTNNGAGNVGTYHLDRWVIELRRDNGEVDRSLFLFTAKERRNVNIAGQAYPMAGKK